MVLLAAKQELLGQPSVFAGKEDTWKTAESWVVFFVSDKTLQKKTQGTGLNKPKPHSPSTRWHGVNVAHYNVPVMLCFPPQRHSRLPPLIIQCVRKAWSRLSMLRNVRPLQVRTNVSSLSIFKSPQQNPPATGVQGDTALGFIPAALFLMKVNVFPVFYLLVVALHSPRGEPAAFTYRTTKYGVTFPAEKPVSRPSYI